MNGSPRAAARRLEPGWWWLWPTGAGPAKFSAFNSRDDRLLRSWRGPLQHRALLPASWYIEKKVRFGLPEGEAFALAAVTSRVVDAVTGEELLSYSMVTRDATGEAAGTWHRMPLVLPESLHEEWIDPARAGDERLVARATSSPESLEIARAMTALSESVGGPAPGAPSDMLF